MRTIEEQERDWLVTEAMLRFGGTFVKNLALLARSADETNMARLKAAWPEYWSKYSQEEFISEGAQDAEASRQTRRDTIAASLERIIHESPPSDLPGLRVIFADAEAKADQLLAEHKLRTTTPETETETDTPNNNNNRRRKS